MNDTGCTCKTPGYCERHQINKTEAWWKLCQTREDYRALWDSGKGPGQSGNVKASDNGKPKKKRKKRCGKTPKKIIPQVVSTNGRYLLPLRDRAVDQGLDRGIITAGESRYWCGIGAHVLAAHREGFGCAVADHGLEDWQRVELERVGVRRIDHFKPELAHHVRGHAAVSPPNAYYKPWVCRSSPFDLTLWVDADAAVVGSTEDVFEIARSHFAIGSQKRYGGVGPNLYRKFLAFVFGEDVVNRWIPHLHGLNTGVMAFHRDDEIVLDWCDTTYSVLQNEPLMLTARVRDQACFMLLYMRRVLEGGRLPIILSEEWNWPADGLNDTVVRDRKYVSPDPSQFLREAIDRHPNAVVVHWLSRPKPWELHDKPSPTVVVNDPRDAHIGPGAVLRRMLGCDGKGFPRYDHMDMMAGICEEHIDDLADTLHKFRHQKMPLVECRRVIESALKVWDAQGYAFATKRPRHGFINERRRICAACPRFGSQCELIRTGNYAQLVITKAIACPHDGNRWRVWYQEASDVISPASSRCVVTVAVGRLCHEILEVTRPSMRSYAERCEADFIALTNRTQVWGWLEKFRVHEVAKWYDQTLFLDADIVVRTDSGDLFRKYDDELVVLHDDYPWLPSVAWLSEERQQVYEACGIVGDPHRNTCWNSGVVLTRREAADIWKPPARTFRPSHCAEQLIVEHNTIPFEPVLLPVEYNTQWWMKQFRQLLDRAHFVHLANCPAHERVALAKEVMR